MQMTCHFMYVVCVYMHSITFLCILIYTRLKIGEPTVMAVYFESSLSAWCSSNMVISVTVAVVCSPGIVSLISQETFSNKINNCLPIDYSKRTV